jgi:hypothetical protein
MSTWHITQSGVLCAASFAIFLEGDLELLLRKRLPEVADHRPVDNTLATGADIRNS